MSEDGRTFKAGDVVMRRGSPQRFEVIAISGGWLWLDPLADSQSFSGRLEDVDFIEPAEPPSTSAGHYGVR
ncbi:hypothetical protein [Rhodoblastus sp.]|jgi:hypothetical protein|uniref:hypothetical protein n=1 Tax=Rhodoblastus sp. TaxID=1962975 RepID=UPI003F9B0234